VQAPADQHVFKIGRKSGLTDVAGGKSRTTFGSGGRSNIEVEPMKTVWIRCTVAAALAGMAALIAIAAGGAQSRTAAGASIRVAQYCAPATENAETHRIYCRTDGS
jgi:hypothetical protein